MKYYSNLAHEVEKESHWPYEDFKVVEVITGKGIHSEGKPVLKPLINDMLKNRNYKFTPINDGGAFLVDLSVRSKL